MLLILQNIFCRKNEHRSKSQNTKYNKLPFIYMKWKRLRSSNITYILWVCHWQVMFGPKHLYIMPCSRQTFIQRHATYGTRLQAIKSLDQKVKHSLLSDFLTLSVLHHPPHVHEECYPYSPLEGFLLWSPSWHEYAPLQNISCNTQKWLHPLQHKWGK
jgi:hypothetical protein